MTAGDAPLLFVGRGLAYAPGAGGSRLDRASVPRPRRRAARERPGCGPAPAPATVTAAGLEAVEARLRSGERVVALTGDPPTTPALLQALARHEPAGFPDGVVCVGGPADAAAFGRAVWHALFTTDGARYAPTPAELRADLAGMAVLALVDGWEPAAGRPEDLAALLPRGAVVLGGPPAAGAADSGRSTIGELALAGHIEAAHALAERAVAAATSAAERASALHERGTLAALLDRREEAAADLSQAAALHGKAGNAAAADLASHNLAVIAPDRNRTLAGLLAAALLALLAVALAISTSRDSGIDFGEVRVGDDARRLEELRNPGGGGLDVMMTLSEEGATSTFCLQLAAGAQCGGGRRDTEATGPPPPPTCTVAEWRAGSPVVSLPPGARCTFEIVFTPELPAGVGEAGFAGDVAFAVVGGSRAGQAWSLSLRGRGVAGRTATPTLPPAGETADRPPALGRLSEQTLQVGQALAVEVSATDPDGDPLTLTADGLPAWAALTDDGDGTATITGTPAETDTGTSRARITATAGGQSDTATLTITVAEAADAPPELAPPGSHTVAAGQQLVVALAATDPDGDPVTLTARNLPGWAALTDNGDGTGTIAGTPAAADAGTTQARITAAAGGKIDNEVMTITVEVPADAPPNLRNVGSHATRVGEPLLVPVAATDPDGDPVTLTAEGLPAWAVLTDNGDGTGAVAGTPGDGDTGTTQARITATANAQSDTEILTITVTGPDDGGADRPPNLTNPGSHSAEVGQPLTVELAATDPDGDAIVLGAADLPAWATLTDNGDGTGTVAGTPGEDDAGTTQALITATAREATDTEILTITVTG